MKDLFHKYGWNAIGALYFACIIGHSITEDNFFLTTMIILGVPIAVWAMWVFGCQSLKFVFDRPFRETEWTEASTLGKVWFLLSLAFLLLVGVFCILGIYFCVDLLLSRL
jgi:hypothetical protein